MKFQYEPGRFYSNDAQGEMIAEVTFQDFAENTAYAIDHTFVRNDYRGQGIAAQLIQTVVDKAKADGKTILPLCTYAKAAFLKHPEYQAIEYKY